MKDFIVLCCLGRKVGGESDSVQMSIFGTCLLHYAAQAHNACVFM